MDRDGVCTYNKKGMASFIAAIKGLRDYAGEIGDTAVKGLQRAMASGKPLNARMVSDTLADLAAHKQQIRGLCRCVC